jgi:opacity protein-like surface antigen
MRNLFVVGIVAAAALMAAPAVAADYPEYPTYELPELPPVDMGLTGGFYLRGSVAGNMWDAVDGQHCACVADFNKPGYGYSLGVGFGYETGTGLRADLTVDYLSNGDLNTTAGYTVNLRSGLVLANLYYDYQFYDGGGAAGGLGGYVGAGIGFAKNYSEVLYGNGTQYAWGSSVEAAAALMAGLSYDMGTAVADVGWRGIYMNKVMNQPPAIADAYLINHNFINELRASVRYRLY